MSNYDIKCKVIEEELRLVWPEWHVAGHLGGGAFGDVFQIYKENYGIRMDSALKVIQVSSRMSTVALPFERPSEKSVDTDSYDDIPDSLRSEIQIMEALRGAPNVVSIEDFYFRKEGTTSYLFVRMELLTSLEEVLVGMDGQRLLSSIPEIHKLGRDICNALMYCEKQGKGFLPGLRQPVAPGGPVHPPDHLPFPRQGRKGRHQLKVGQQLPVAAAAEQKGIRRLREPGKQQQNDQPALGFRPLAFGQIFLFILPGPGHDVPPK